MPPLRRYSTFSISVQQMNAEAADLAILDLGVNIGRRL